METKESREELLKRKEDRATEVVLNRLLTQEEHEKIKIEKAMQGVVDVRRKVNTEIKAAENSSNIVAMNKIEGVDCRRVSRSSFYF